METSAPRVNLWLVAAGIAILWLLSRLETVATLFLVSWFLSYALHPAVQRLAKWRIPRPLAILILFAAAGLAVAVFAVVAVPTIADQLYALAAALPTYAQNLKTGLLPQLESVVGRPLPVDPSSLLSEAVGNAQKILPELARGTATVFGRVFANAWNLLQGLLTALLVPFFSFYLLLDLEGLGGRITELFPRGWQPRVKDLLTRCDEVLSAFIRGQLTICCVLALVYSVGLTLTGIDLPWVVGLLSGLLFIVPYLGTAVGVVVGSLLALLKFHDLGHLLGVWAVFAVGQSLEGLFLTPRIVGHRVGLHPLAVIAAVMAGGELFGFLGVLLAVPTAAVLRVGIREALSVYRSSTVYRGDEP